MTKITPYMFEQHEVRVVVGEDGEPWFVSADVCAALALGNASAAMTRLDPDERGVASIDTPGGPQQMAVVNEPGLYALTLGSRKPEARRFKRWVTHDVIPAIRKTGRYEAMAHQDAEVAALLVLSKSQLLRMAADQAEQIERQEILLAAQAPKVEAHDRYLDASGTMCLRDAAKTLGLREHEFVRTLIADGVLYRTPGDHGRLRAYAHHEETGRFAHRAGTAEKTGKAYTQVRVTPAGLDWLSQRYPAQRALLPTETADV